MNLPSRSRRAAAVQPFLDVRGAVLDGTLERSFRRLYPDFRPTPLPDE